MKVRAQWLFADGSEGQTWTVDTDKAPAYRQLGAFLESWPIDITGMSFDDVNGDTQIITVLP